jgi:hypothetical protein
VGPNTLEGSALPFRVALPTYAYLVAFDAKGITARHFRRGSPLRVAARFAGGPLEADPTELALLVNEWMQKRPALMTGIIWYRLPVKAD